MLVLSRKLGEKIFIGDNICITVVDIDRGKIRLGIEAPRNVPIYRQELLPLNNAPEAGRALGDRDLNRDAEALFRKEPGAPSIESDSRTYSTSLTSPCQPRVVRGCRRFVASLLSHELRELFPIFSHVGPQLDCFSLGRDRFILACRRGPRPRRKHAAPPHRRAC